MLGKGLQLKANNLLVFFLWLVKPSSPREMWEIFSDFQYNFRPSCSTSDLLTVVPDTIARPFNSYGATRAVAVDIFKSFDRVWNTGFLRKLKSGISGHLFGLISSCIIFSVIDGFEWFWIGSFRKNIQLMLEFLKASFLVLLFSYYILMTFLMMLPIILLSMLMILLSTLN